MTKPTVISIINHKGGVGKTTTAINLATALAAVGKRILLIDLDPQGNAGAGLGIDRAAVPEGTAQLLRGEKTPIQLAIETKVPGVMLIASSIQLATEDIKLGSGGKPEYRLKTALVEADVFDAVVVDCPPSFGILSLNALVAADKVLIPVQSESFALEGLTQILATLTRVKGMHNPDIQHGIVLTMFDEKERINTLVAQEARAHFGARVLGSVIPREERISEAAFRGLPILILDPTCEGARAYVLLAAETLYRLGLDNEALGEEDPNLGPALKSFAGAAGRTLAKWAGAKHRERSEEALEERAMESAAPEELPPDWGKAALGNEERADPTMFESPTPKLVSLRALMVTFLLAMASAAGLVYVVMVWPS